MKVVACFSPTSSNRYVPDGPHATRWQSLDLGLLGEQIRRRSQAIVGTSQADGLYDESMRMANKFQFMGSSYSASNGDLPRAVLARFMTRCANLKPLPVPAASKLDLRCYCDKQFCKDHIFPDAYQCLVDPSRAPVLLPKALRPRCLQQAQPRCIPRRLERRRYAGAAMPTALRIATHHKHACPVPELVAAPKNEAAHALLAKHFSTSAAKMNNRPAWSAPKCKVPTDPKKQAQLEKEGRVHEDASSRGARRSGRQARFDWDRSTIAR
ncbi:hypothetical protein F5148DRAFT_596463 [Russula earlei]|uniref:Uncharacterized protein n=1 Tax=Russula earlei TaxID=71964 RepID=A0ACC0TV93_9AGAM|nr:hypothetical protein F5148DRAFT_596463 [Russula earlei]